MAPYPVPGPAAADRLPRGGRLRRGPPRRRCGRPAPSLAALLSMITGTVRRGEQRLGGRAAAAPPPASRCSPTTPTSASSCPRSGTRSASTAAATTWPASPSPACRSCVIGHNRRIAWGITNLCGDVQDLYIEKLDDPHTRRRYQFQGQLARPRIRHESDRRQGEARTSTSRCARPSTARSSTTPSRSCKASPPTGPALAGPRRHPPGRRPRGAQPRGGLALLPPRARHLGHAERQLRLRRRRRPHRLPVDRPRSPSAPPATRGWCRCPAGTAARDWQGLHPLRGDASRCRSAGRLHRHRQQQGGGGRLPLLHRLRLWPTPTAPSGSPSCWPPATSSPWTACGAIQAETARLPAAALRPYLLAVPSRQTTEQEKALDEVRRWDLRYTPESAGASVYEVWYWLPPRRHLRRRAGRRADERVPHHRPQPDAAPWST